MDVSVLTPPSHQPILDVPAYLDSRKPVPHFTTEPSLFSTLPSNVKSELRSLLGRKPGDGAFGSVNYWLNRRLSITKSCAAAYPAFGHLLPCGLKQFRAKFDLYRRKQDWVALVNRSKAGAAWQAVDIGLADETLRYIEQRLASFTRKDGKRQAVLSLHRQWETGLTPKHHAEPIPGYEAGWRDRNPHLLPAGFSYTNILQQLKKRARLTDAASALIQQGTAAAKELLPRHLTTRVGLRFLERVTFDDVRTDWLVFDTAAGQPCELWLLVARDHATGMVLGFVMHPCLVRPDGSVSRLGLKEMKQLVAWILERYPLPPYVSHWTIERGTATITQGDGAALMELLPGQINLHYTSMIGGTSPTGYAEKKKGNSTGKASHESHNRLFHTQGAYIPGQTGNRWDIRPADLQARCDEAAEIWELRNHLPEHLRGQERYPLLLLPQAREHLVQICLQQNFRTHHALEGFEKVLEWFDPAFDNGPGKPPGSWRHQSTFPSSLDVENSPPSPSRLPAFAVAPPVQGSTVQGSKFQFRTRMESPVERAIKLMSPYAGQWTKCSPDIIITFLSHTVRKVQLKPTGEIQFTVGGAKLTFAPPFNPFPHLTHLTSSQLLGYHSPEDPSFLHVTDGHGRILGTWFRRARLGYQDQELLAQAMRYTSAALSAVQQTAAALTAPERADLDQMRAHNQDLLDRGNTYIDTAEQSVQLSTLNPQPSTSPSVARALTAIPRQRQRHEDTQSTDEALAASLDSL